MAREQIVEHAQNYTQVAATYGKKAGSTALSRLSGMFDTASRKSSEYASHLDSDSSRGKAAKTTGVILTGAAIVAAAGGSWLMRHNQASDTTQEGMDPYRTEPSSTPVRDDADRAAGERLVHAAPVGTGSPDGPTPVA